MEEALELGEELKALPGATKPSLRLTLPSNSGEKTTFLESSWFS